jgi:hypothetical protein
MAAYERFPLGSTVRVVSYQALETFMYEWKWHHPLVPEQLGYAGRTGVVKDVGFYHGGDVLYQLEGIPGTWHEANLESVSAEIHGVR